MMRKPWNLYKPIVREFLLLTSHSSLSDISIVNKLEFFQKKLGFTTLQFAIGVGAVQCSRNNEPYSCEVKGLGDKLQMFLEEYKSSFGS